MKCLEIVYQKEQDIVNLIVLKKNFWVYKMVIFL